MIGLCLMSDWLLAFLLLLSSAFCEYIDSSIGMGYGTTLHPVLLILGLTRQEIVPALLLAQMLSGITSGIAHHKENNVNLRTNKNIHKALWIISIPSVVGAIIASFTGIHLDVEKQQYLNLYIGIMVISIGFFLIFNCIFRKKLPITS